MPVSVQPETRNRRKIGAAQPVCSHQLWRPLIDAAVAGLAFVLVSTMFVAPVKAGTYSAPFAGLHHTAATSTLKAVAAPAPLPIVQIATASSPADAVYRQTGTTAAWGLLGMAFSMLAALNLAILRHVKRVYAPRFALSGRRDRVIGRCGATRY
ncbi:hypothetical protein [Hyphomicrobium sp. 99]|uniref:hypothetical protein n=1 Tax=Hyphomicrobium sp. 99 TaxID=1163419 RepID=UPI000696E954|nr:hypothetical protein [Hyphomicrobium sp. 99]